MRTTKKLYTRAEEAAHTLTHGLGLALSVAGMVLLVAAAATRGGAWHVVGCSIFAATLVLMYAASTLYHGSSGRAKTILQRLDHGAIYLLIAGTYTPFTLVNLRGPWGWTLFGLVWGLAALGLALEVRMVRRRRRFSVPLYLAMGWLIVIAAGPLVAAVEWTGVLLLIFGGVAYTAGVAFYAWRALPYGHAVWHVFVMAGSSLHFASVLGYVIPSAG